MFCVICEGISTFPWVKMSNNGAHRYQLELDAKFVRTDYLNCIWTVDCEIQIERNSIHSTTHTQRPMHIAQHRLDCVITIHFQLLNDTRYLHPFVLNVSLLFYTISNSRHFLSEYNFYVEILSFIYLTFQRIFFSVQVCVYESYGLNILFFSQ